MDSDVNTRLYRRFGWERNRILLHKQDLIVCLSDELKNLDRYEDRMSPIRLWSRRYDDEKGPSQRKLLLQRLEQALTEFDTLLLREHEISSLTRPTKGNHRTIFDWVFNEKPVVKPEYQYLNQTDDFVLLGNQQDTWLRTFQEKIWALSHIAPFQASTPDSTSPSSLFY